MTQNRFTTKLIASLFTTNLYDENVIRLCEELISIHSFVLFKTAYRIEYKLIGSIEQTCEVKTRSQ